MGLHSDAIALAAKCGKGVQDCKRALKEKQAEVDEALRNSGGKDRIDVLAALLYGATPTAPSPPPIEKAIDPEPESQVSTPEIVKGVMETHDEDSVGFILEDEEAPKPKKKKKRKKR